jgi:DeoR family ulaG and ulaABCDEF operon transcriptional repressor
MFMGVYGLSMLGLMEADPMLIQAEKHLISPGRGTDSAGRQQQVRQEGRPDPVRSEPRLLRHHGHGAPEQSVRLLEQRGVRVVIVTTDDTPDGTLPRHASATE